MTLKAVYACDGCGRMEATTTHLYSKTATAVGDIYTLDCPITSGISVALGASTTVTVVYR